MKIYFQYLRAFCLNILNFSLAMLYINILYVSLYLNRWVSMIQNFTELVNADLNGTETVYPEIANCSLGLCWFSKEQGLRMLV